MQQDVDSGEELKTFRGSEHALGSVSFSPDGKRLAGVPYGYGPDGNRLAGAPWETVKLLDADSGQEVMTLKGQAGPITAIAFSPDSKYLAGHVIWTERRGPLMVVRVTAAALPVILHGR